MDLVTEKRAAQFLAKENADSATLAAIVSEVEAAITQVEVRRYSRWAGDRRRARFQHQLCRCGHTDGADIAACR